MAKIDVQVDETGTVTLSGSGLDPQNNLDITNSNRERLVWFSITDPEYIFADEPIGLSSAPAGPNDPKPTKPAEWTWDVKKNRVAKFNKRNFVMLFKRGPRRERVEWYNLKVLSRDGSKEFFLDPRIRNGGEDPESAASAVSAVVAAVIGLVCFGAGIALDRALQ